MKHPNKNPCDRFLDLWQLLGWWLVLTSGAFTGPLGTVTLEAAEPVRFSEHVLANEHRYIFGIATVDIDGDGDLDLTYPDIYTGGAQGESNLYWLENNGQGKFQRHVIHKDQQGWMERHATGDINGDGRLDVVMVDNWNGRLFWFVNPDGPADSHWKQYIITTKCQHAYDVVLSDLDGDGDLDAAAAGLNPGRITWYENPGRDGQHDEWTRRVIDEGMPVARTIAAGDFNSDGKIDLLATATGKRYFSANVQDHGCQVVWYENLDKTPSGRWKKHTIDNQSWAPAHGHPVDMDADGDLDVVMAHGVTTHIDIKVERHGVVWYENVDQPKSGRSWKKHLVGHLPFAFEAIARDLDGDGDMDVIATAWANTLRLYGQPVTTPGGDRVVWFENRGRDQWVVHSLQDKFFGASQVITADLNGDGRPDIIATCDGEWVNREQGSKSEIRWWRNEADSGK
ncbi:MAG: VCBS repeat-containing protein [Pirellulaceae bacterium]|nr:VCBS repeat-containing protein [Pirellulaceae bacterium]